MVTLAFSFFSKAEMRLAYAFFGTGSEPFEPNVIEPPLPPPLPAELPDPPPDPPEQAASSGALISPTAPRPSPETNVRRLMPESPVPLAAIPTPSCVGNAPPVLHAPEGPVVQRCDGLAEASAKRSHQPVASYGGGPPARQPRTACRRRFVTVAVL